MKQLIIYINKKIGETGLLREEATLDHICQHSKNMARDIAVMHPFVDGNKRTAYIALKIIHRYTALDIQKDREWLQALINHQIQIDKEWLDVLKEC